MLSFGVTVLPDPPYERFLELIKLAEQHGFEYGWTYDSHILWQESYATLPLVAAATSVIPASRPGVTGFSSNPTQPKWSTRSDAIAWPARISATSVTAPSFGAVTIDPST